MEGADYFQLLVVSVAVLFSMLWHPALKKELYCILTKVCQRFG